MLKKTKEKMIEYAQSLPAGTERAKAYRISQLTAGNSIAEALENDHSSEDGALRAASIMVRAGCAIEKNKKPGFYGTFVFEDGSEL